MGKLRERERESLAWSARDILRPATDCARSDRIGSDRGIPRIGFARDPSSTSSCGGVPDSDPEPIGLGQPSENLK